MRILVSNDDGIDAPGIEFLAAAMGEFGEVYVVAPDREQSAASHSLTLHRPLRILPRGLRRFAVDGTPTDCVNLAVKTILKGHPPDLVVSGINQGPNLGDDVIYSGTVAAAMEGTILGILSIAFSLATRDGPNSNFVPAAEFAKKLVRTILQAKPKKDMLLNVNIPAVKGNPDLDFEFTRMGRRHYGDEVVEKVDPRGRKYYWIGGDQLAFDEEPGTDCNAIREGRVSITPLCLDMTHTKHIEEIRQWKF